MPTHQMEKKIATTRKAHTSVTAPDHLPASMPSVLGLASEADTSRSSPSVQNQHAIWFTFDENNQEMPLSPSSVQDLLANPHPKIIITGDGHSKPPFQYARHIPGVMKKLQAGGLRFFVEETQTRALEQRSSYLPKQFDDYGFIKKKKTELIGWEDPVMQSRTSAMFDTIVKLMEEKISDELVTELMIHVSVVCAHMLNHGYEALATDLQGSARKFRDQASGGDQTQIQRSLRSLMGFASGLWRDQYVNPELARKLADAAAVDRDATLLVSVGDAHLVHNPVQVALNNLRRSEGFAHQILFNKSKAAEIPVR